MVIRDILPHGLLGLLLAAFLAAYMSTIASQTVWGTSYIVNDLFKPFIKRGAKEKYYVKVARITTFVLMIFSLFVTSKFDRISDAWIFVLNCSAGIGLVLILRWFWWRINAWTEISAILAPFTIYPFIYKHVEFPNTLLIIVAWSSLVWLVVTFLTKPEREEKLKSFYFRVHPGGAGWKRIAGLMPEVKGDSGYKYLFINWAAGCILVIFTLFGFGKIIFGEFGKGFLFVAIGLVAGSIIYFNMKKIGWEKIAE